MRIERKKKGFAEPAEGDLTPMIDMVFQLIAFFMVLINFAQAEQDRRITLPASQLAMPPDVQPENAITLHVDDKNDTIVFSGQELSLTDLEGHLRSKANEFRNNEIDMRDVTVILRGDRHAKTGFVQQVIEACKNTDYENFKLRAEFEKPNQ